MQDHSMEQDNKGKDRKERRDLELEFKLTKWIESVNKEIKPSTQSFEDWLSNGSVLSRLMTTVCFNSIPDDMLLGTNNDSDAERVKVLVYQIRHYGVDEKLLFEEEDLLYKENIPRVSRCIKEIAMMARKDSHIKMDSLDN